MGSHDQVSTVLHKQRITEHLAQAFQCMGNRRLGQVQLLARLNGAARIRHGEHDPEQVEIPSRISFLHWNTCKIVIIHIPEAALVCCEITRKRPCGSRASGPFFPTEDRS